VLIATLLLLSPLAFLAPRQDSLPLPAVRGEFPPYENLLPNGEMEIDEDVDNVPDGWNIYTWVPTESGPLKEAVMRYLDIDVPEIGVSMERRRTFLGDRSARLFTITGKIGPGIWSTVDLSPGIYTLTLVARSLERGSRVVATFLAQEGRLAQIDEKWRWIAHSEVLPYATPSAPIMVNDLTFQEGGILVDHMSLVKLPFDIRYEKNAELAWGENLYVVEIANVPGETLPIGANLEVHSPSGAIVRKNIELEVNETKSQFVFTLLADSVGEYTAALELYNPRTTSILYKDESIRARLSGGQRTSTRRSDGSLPEDFFPIGISVKGYELDALVGKGMNTILLKDPDPLDISEVLEKARQMGLRCIVELDASDSSLFSDREREVIEKTKGSSSLLGYSLLSGWGHEREKQAFLRSAARELGELDPSTPIFLRNYLPGPLDAGVLGSVNVLFVDPFPITVPAKPLYTIVNWMRRISEAGQPRMKKVAVVQMFAGWPYAKRMPSVDELRNLIRLSLAHGADGIIFHTFSGDFHYFDDAASSNWDVRRVPEMWDALDDLVRETADFHRKFGKPEERDLPVIFLPEGALDVASFDDDMSLHIQVVNVLPEPVGTRSVSPLFHQGDTVRTYPEGDEIVCGDGFFEDALPAHGVRVYDLSRLIP
jgi:hypothetical protein